MKWEPSFFMRTEGHRQTDVMKVIVALRNFANVPKTFWWQLLPNSRISLTREE